MDAFKRSAAAKKAAATRNDKRDASRTASQIVAGGEALANMNVVDAAEEIRQKLVNNPLLCFTIKIGLDNGTLEKTLIPSAEKQPEESAQPVKLRQTCVRFKNLPGYAAKELLQSIEPDWVLAYSQNTSGLPSMLDLLCYALQVSPEVLLPSKYNPDAWFLPTLCSMALARYTSMGSRLAGGVAKFKNLEYWSLQPGKVVFRVGEESYDIDMPSGEDGMPQIGDSFSLG